jgi:hypothetical protein
MMRSYDVRHHREPEARSVDAAHASFGAAPKLLKHGVAFAGRNADAVVADGDKSSIACGSQADVDRRLTRRILDGVVDEVPDRTRKRSLVTGHDNGVGPGRPNLMTRGAGIRIEFVNDATNESGQVEWRKRVRLRSSLHPADIEE